MPLTDTRIRNAKPKNKPYKLADSGGLLLEVRPSGSKLWRYRYRIAGKENTFALGDYADVGLADARDERDRARRLVKQGIHPAHNRHAHKAAQITANANSFETVACEWIEKNKARWTPYYLRQVERFLKADVYPYIGALPIKSVSAAHLLETVKRVEKRAPTVALLIRQWSSAVFRYAVSTLRADGDPTAALKGALSRPKVRHHKPLSATEIPEFLKTLEASGAYRATKIALRLLLLTFVRPIELRAAEWSEFDIKRAEWRIPANRMKMREPHIVPLSHQALLLLEELKTLTGGQRWLFPNLRRPKVNMTMTTLNAALSRMGYRNKFSAHGFRATASTQLNEMDYRPDVIERQLAHKPHDQVRASYNQAEYLPERRKIMQAWADYVDGLCSGADVTPIRKHAA